MSELPVQDAEFEATLRRLGYYVWQAWDEVNEESVWCSVTGFLKNEPIVIAVSRKQVDEWPGWARGSELDRFRAEVERQAAEIRRMAAVVEAARAFRQAKVNISKRGWAAVPDETAAVEAMFKALIALDADAPSPTPDRV